LEVLSISALDIFASALGVFVLMAIFLFPYYLKQPAREIAEQGARAEMAAAGLSVIEAESEIAEAEQRKTAAEEAVEQARSRLQQAQESMAQTTRNPAPAREESEAPQDAKKSSGQQQVSLAISDLDLVFVMDTTGSMRDELEDVQANLVGIIRILHRLAASLRVGFVAFKDREDAYLTRVFPLDGMDDRNVARILDFVKGLKAQGGGDIPEPINLALEKAATMSWRENAQGLIIVVGDAPVHPLNRDETLQMVRDFRNTSPSSTSPRSVSAIFTGKNRRSREFFRQLARAGGGDFSVHQGHMLESVLLSILPARK
jgi:Mg-chelatase subunit ChlD